MSLKPPQPPDSVLVTAGLQGPTGATGATGAQGPAGTGAGFIDGATQTLRVQDVLFGAEGDGILVRDANITSGTAALTSSEAAFTSADIGKHVLVVGAGASGADLSTTIQSVAAGTATLATNAGTTVVSGWCVYGTDDTDAIEDAIDYLVSNGGGRLVFDDGIYIVAGALRTTIFGTGYYHQIGIRQVDQNSEAVNVEILGARKMGYYPGWDAGGGVGEVGPFEQGVILQSMLVGCTPDGSDHRPGMIGAKHGGWTNVNLDVSNIHFRTSVDPSLVPLDCLNVLSANVEDCGFSTMSGVGIPIEPTNFCGVAYQAPQQNNDVMNTIRNLTICGYYVGLLPGEHLASDGTIAIDNCYVAIGMNACNHAIHLGRVTAQWCPYVVTYVDPTDGVSEDGLPSGRMHMDIDYLDIEDATGSGGFAWGEPIKHVADGPSGTGGTWYGRVKYHRVIKGTGYEGDPWTLQGGKYLHVIHPRKFEGIHYIGTGGEPAFENSWANTGFSDGTGTYTSVGFWKDQAGIVHLCGQTTGGATTNSIFTLPTDYRPSRTLLIGIQTGGASNAPAACNLRIGADGTVTPYFSSGSPLLDGVSFGTDFTADHDLPG